MLAHVRLRRLLDWYGPALAATVVALVLTAGFGLALTGRFGRPLAPLPARAAATPRTGAYHIVALGDSITDGVGDPGGRGYASRVSEALRRRGLTVIFTNLAVSGSLTADVLAVMRKDEARRLLARADLILVSAGGNDLSRSLRSIADNAEAEPELALGRARANLETMMRELRAANDRAAIRLVGLYNPFDIEAKDAASARRQLAEWNSTLDQVTYPYDDALAVPVADAFAGRADRLAGDRYHPGPGGHAVIAGRVLETLPEADVPRR
jgi:lysophospholipase L1-like esterase